jgi:hypothetical protein
MAFALCSKLYLSSAALSLSKGRPSSAVALLRRIERRMLSVI